MTKPQIDYLDIETASDTLSRAIDLLTLQEEEIGDLEHATFEVGDAKTSQGLSIARELLIAQCQNRCNFLVSLNNTVLPLLTKLHDQLEKVIEDETNPKTKEAE